MVSYWYFFFFQEKAGFGVRNVTEFKTGALRSVTEILDAEIQFASGTELIVLSVALRSEDSRDRKSAV